MTGRLVHRELGAVPPFKHVRHLLRDAAIGFAWLYWDIGDDLRTGWPTDSLGWTVIDASTEVDEIICPRFGTRLRLNLLRRRILVRLEQKQVLAQKNGRHWPLPSAMTFLVGPEGEVKTRCGFALSFQLDEITWCEALQRAVGSRRGTLATVDAGDFAVDEEVAALIAKYLK